MHCRQKRGSGQGGGRTAAGDGVRICHPLVGHYGATGEAFPTFAMVNGRHIELWHALCVRADREPSAGRRGGDAAEADGVDLRIPPGRGRWIVGEPLA